MNYLDCTVSPPLLSKKIFASYPLITVINACFYETARKRIILGVTRHRSQDGFIDSLCKIDITDNGFNRYTQLESFTGPQDISPVGITTDGCRRIFVSDPKSECIRVYDLNDKYKGQVLRKGEQGLGKPGAIRWCNATSSLVISHHDEKFGYKISVLNYFEPNKPL